MSSEGDHSREYFVGKLDPNSYLKSECKLQDVEHVTSRPVSFTAYADNVKVATHTIFEFLSLKRTDGPIVRRILFARRGMPEVFYLIVRIVPVVWSLSVAVSQIVRLRGRKPEDLLVDVIHYPSPHLVFPQQFQENFVGRFYEDDTSIESESHNIVAETYSRLQLRYRVRQTGHLLTRSKVIGIVTCAVSDDDGSVLLNGHPVDLSLPDAAHSLTLGDYLILVSLQVKSAFSLLPSSLASRGANEHLSSSNRVRLFVDGVHTFRAYYDCLRRARKSISILGWELSLSLGLVRMEDGWVTLQDVILAKAAAGCLVRIMVWRHDMLSWMNRLLYLGEVTIERECTKLQRRARAAGVECQVLTTVFDLPNDVLLDAISAPASSTSSTGKIAIVICGNPRGIVSCHHEKLVLVDECVAFAGGFDIARGRFDQQAHKLPRPYHTLELMDAAAGASSSLSRRSSASAASPTEPIPFLPDRAPLEMERYGDKMIQPLWRHIRFLWHDVQMQLMGPCVSFLRLHFEQRWMYAFTRNSHRVKSLSLSSLAPAADSDVAAMAAYFAPSGGGGSGSGSMPHSQQHHSGPRRFEDLDVQVMRGWHPVFHSQVLIDAFSAIIGSAQRFLYVEHQYPFHNFTLTHLMCEQLRRQPDLKLIVVTPIRTDLPTGIVGNLIDMSQDHINENLRSIAAVAPDRVGVYGLVSVDQHRIKAIYVHTKLIVADDQCMMLGSANMDNMSLYKASELVFKFDRAADLATDTRTRLWTEHLYPRFGEFTQLPAKTIDFDEGFAVFKELARLNLECARSGRPLVGRPVSLVPEADYAIVRSLIEAPNPLAKIAMKLGLPRTEEIVQKVALSGQASESGFFLQSML